MATILALGFASGLPLALTGSTLSVWLSEAGVSKTTIGIFALLTLPYASKFLWAPAIDRLPLPWFSRRFGRRRGWTLAMQALLAAAVLGLGASDPRVAPLTTAVWALALSFASASQDVVIDAYRVELLEEPQFAAGAATVVAGYRLGMLVSGAGALFLAELVAWFWVYAAMAAALGVGALAVLLSPEPAAPARAVQATRRSLLGWFAEAVWSPLADFLGRPGFLAVLAFVALFKLGDALAGVMTNPFLLELGFSKAEIASVVKGFGLAATLAGGFIGGLMLARAGLLRGLLLAGVLQMLSNLMFLAQAKVGHDLAFLALTIAVENAAGGIGTAAFVAFLSTLCRVEYTATQYALLSALAAFARTGLASGSGWLADSLGWPLFFALSALAALPALLLLPLLSRKQREASRTTPWQPN
ncbi:MAG: AmpG family muropeptide MFS transporter [Alphaproteobacteria bacterium]|nr:AmpG family muropeptide MFS transporter [Alphaproteobacteria bacterium]